GRASLPSTPALDGRIAPSRGDSGDGSGSRREDSPDSAPRRPARSVVGAPRDVAAAPPTGVPPYKDATAPGSGKGADILLQTVIGPVGVDPVEVLLWRYRAGGEPVLAGRVDADLGREHGLALELVHVFLG